MPNLKPCKSCGKEVSSSARICPHCGHKLKGGRLVWLLGGVLLLGLVCCGVSAAFMALFSRGVHKQQQEEEKRVQEEKPIEVTASELVSAYRDNTAAANNKYKGKVLQVAGTVGKIEERWVELESERGFVGGGFDLLRVHIHFNDQDKGKMAALTKGRSITVKGKCTGKGFADSIDIERCVLVP